MKSKYYNPIRLHMPRQHRQYLPVGTPYTNCVDNLWCTIFLLWCISMVVWFYSFTCVHNILNIFYYNDKWNNPREKNISVYYSIFLCARTSTLNNTNSQTFFYRTSCLECRIVNTNVNGNTINITYLRVTVPGTTWIIRTWQ